MQHAANRLSRTRKQLDLLGSSMGSPTDLAALIDHRATTNWSPAFDSVFPLEGIEAAYERLDAPDRIGKVVIDLLSDRA